VQSVPERPWTNLDGLLKTQVGCPTHRIFPGYPALCLTVVHFAVLGDVEVRAGGRRVEVGHDRQRCVLAALLVDANQPVPVEQLLDRVWGDRPPQRARGTLYSYLSRLRQVLADAGGPGIARRPGGYLITVDPMAVDLHRFQRLAAQARTASDPAVAGDLFEQALALWRGTAFGTLDTPWLNGVREAAHRERLSAELDRNDLALGAGRHSAVLGRLSVQAGAVGRAVEALEPSGPRVLEQVRKAARPRRKRTATAPTKASRERRLEDKRQRGKTKRLRQPPAD